MSVAYAAGEIATIAKRDPLVFVNERARRKLNAFTARMYPSFIPAAHIDRLHEALTWAVSTPDARLIVTMPPRHSKSLNVSEHLPAWFLGNNPDKRVIAASHTASLAYTFSRRVRNKIASPLWPFPGVSVADDKGAVSAWDIHNRLGGYVSVGVGGSPTGAGGDLILIDDPIRSQQDADSQTVRDALWEWYQGTLYTRLEPGGSIVLTATRWHDDDLTGRLLDAQAHGGDQWRHVHMPAISDDGTALWPERWSVAALERIRQAVGSKVFEAQYQGRPVPGEGGTFKHDWWQRYRELPEIVRLEIAVDSAFKTGTANDYSVFAAWGVSRLDNAYLLNVFRERVAFPDLIRLGYAAVDWAKGSFPFLEPLLVVEDQASGQSAIQMWESGEQGNRSLSVVPFPVAGQGSKLSRAEGVSPFVEGKRAYIPQDDMFPWVADWLLEHDRFPSGKHDDQVDTTAIALSRLLANSAGDFSDLDAYYDRQLGRR